MAGVRGTGGRPRGRGDRPVSRLRRASESRGAGRVEGVTCGKLARGWPGAGGKMKQGRKLIYKVTEQPRGR